MSSHEHTNHSDNLSISMLSSLNIDVNIADKVTRLFYKVMCYIFLCFSVFSHITKYETINEISLYNNEIKLWENRGIKFLTNFIKSFRIKYIDKEDDVPDHIWKSYLNQIHAKILQQIYQLRHSIKITFINLYKTFLSIIQSTINNVFSTINLIIQY